LPIFLDSNPCYLFINIQDLYLNPAAGLFVPHPEPMLPEAHLQPEAAAPEAEFTGLRRSDRIRKLMVLHASNSDPFINLSEPKSYQEDLWNGSLENSHGRGIFFLDCKRNVGADRPA